MDIKKKTNRYTVFERCARLLAKYPRTFLFASLAVATTLSAIGLIVGDFKVEVDNKGWRSRGTLIADREMQVDLMNLNRKKLFEDTDGSHWEYLKNTLSRGYVDLEERDEVYDRKLLYQGESRKVPLSRNGSRRMNRGLKDFDPFQSAKDNIRNLLSSRKLSNQHSSVQSNPILDNSRFLALEDTCDTSWYSNYEEVLEEDNTLAIWKVQPGLDSTTTSILDKEVMEQICEAEVNTLSIMKEANVCKKCSDGNCLPPHSLVLLLRNKLNDHQSTCRELMNAYTSQVQADFTNQLYNCTNEYVENFDSSTLTPGNSTSCPDGFMPNLVDFFFGKDGNTRLLYTSSYFHTYEADVNAVYKIYRKFDGADGRIVRGVYDTVEESFNQIYVDELVVSDMVSQICVVV
jgi:hypothetical protein